MAFSLLPSELIVRILCYLDEDYLDAIHVGKTAREPYLCSLEPRVWRNLTLRRWKYSKMQFTGLTIDWKAEFVRRFKLDQHIDDTVEKLIHQPDPPNWARIPRFKEAKDWGLDAKDALLRHINIPDTLDDVLARRYWARALLTTIYRRLAIEEWQKIASEEHVSLERAFTTFDMFIRGGEEGDFEYVSHMLDDMTEDFQRWTPHYKTLSTRALALQLADHLVSDRGFRGTNDDNYYDISNNFIGLTLQSPSHEGMPAIYVAIFCAMASRLGFNAQACSFPSHVYAVVQPHDGFDLNGNPRAENIPPDRMYVDCHSTTTLEVNEARLQSTLSEIGVPESQREPYLEPASTIKMVLRMRRNLMHCLQIAANANDDIPASSFLGKYREELVYLILWMTMIFDGGDSGAYERRHSHLHYLLPRLDASFMGDWYLFQEIIMPMFQNSSADIDLINNAINELRQKELMPPVPKYRSDEVRNRVYHKVGTCFRHGKYGYLGMIIGWDAECKAPSSWQTNHRVDELDKGANQCFYPAVSDDGTERYVAQENIGPMPPSGPSEVIMRMAGKYFLRWDNTSMKFISNLKHAYPDD